MNQLLPEDWDSMDIYDRKLFMEDSLSKNGSIERDYVCVAEVWCECLGKNKDDLDRYKTREINDILRSLDDWEQCKSTRNFKIYGKQRFYVRKLE